MFSNQHELFACLLESFDGELAVDHGNDDPAGSSGYGSIDDQKISIVDARSLHGSTTSSQKESGCRSSDELFVEVERSLDVVVSGGGKSGFHP